MTYEKENPDTTKTPTATPPKRENIILNWVLMIVGFGAIMLIAYYLQDFL